jgi:hypothetical protein
VSLAKTAKLLADSTIFRRCYGERHTEKRVARDLECGLSTARLYLNGRIPAAPARRIAIYERMRAQLDRRIDELAEAEAALDALLRAAETPFPTAKPRG